MSISDVIIRDTFVVETAGRNHFGPEVNVFSSPDINPCSIIILDNKTGSDNLKLQVKRDGSDEWVNYDEGQLLIAREVYLRAAAPGEMGMIKVKVLS